MFLRNSEKLGSFIGINTHFKGEIRTSGTLRIDGTLEGDIEADWIVVGDKAVIKGNASARGIIVGGSVEGNLNAKEIVEIKQKGSIRGDIITNRLTVAEGAILDGRTTMKREETKAIEFSAETPALRVVDNKG